MPGSYSGLQQPAPRHVRRPRISARVRGVALLRGCSEESVAVGRAAARVWVRRASGVAVSSHVRGPRSCAAWSPRYLNANSTGHSTYVHATHGASRQVARPAARYFVLSSRPLSRRRLGLSVSRSAALRPLAPRPRLHSLTLTLAHSHNTASAEAYNILAIEGHHGLLVRCHITPAPA